jgi:hypothetical protein
MSPLFTRLRITDKGELTRRWTPKERQIVEANATNQPKNPASPLKRDAGLTGVSPEAAERAMTARERASDKTREDIEQVEAEALAAELALATSRVKPRSVKKNTTTQMTDQGKIRHRSTPAATDQEKWERRTAQWERNLRGDS